MGKTKMLLKEYEICSECKKIAQYFVAFKDGGYGYFCEKHFNEYFIKQKKIDGSWNFMFNQRILSCEVEYDIENKEIFEL
jgi:hypothetical protein